MGAMAVTNRVHTPCSRAFIPSAYRQVVLPAAARAEKQDVVAALHVAAGPEFPDPHEIDRGLKLEGTRNFPGFFCDAKRPIASRIYK